MTRSSCSMNWVRQLSSVVLPEPVPPEIRTLQRTRADDLQNLRAVRRDRSKLDQLVQRQLVFLEFCGSSMRGRQSRAAERWRLTREPSASRASQIGEDSSTRRPTWLTMR